MRDEACVNTERYDGCFPPSRFSAISYLVFAFHETHIYVFLRGAPDYFPLFAEIVDA